MDMKGLMSALAYQIDAATLHAGFERRLATRDRGPVESILRSLRVTHLALSTGFDPRKDAPHLFSLNVTERGDYVLTQDGAAVPVNLPYLTYLFWSAGVELLPGQFVLVEPDVAKLVIEEALGRVALDQAFTEREWVTQRSALEVSAALPRREELDALRDLEARASQLWDRKLELIAASLLADEALERASPEAA